MNSTMFPIALVCAFLCLACGSSDSAPVSADVDAAANDDANVSSDAAKSTVGASCSPTASDSSGGCSADELCVGPTIDTAHCHQVCPQLTQTCTNYGGPGVGICSLTVTDPETNQPAHICRIMCECPDAACDGTCPGDLACTEVNRAGLKLCE